MEFGSINKRETVERRNRLCELNFELTESQYDKSSPERFVVEHWEDTELIETIALLNPLSKQSMYLHRSIGASEANSTFRYRLSEELSGFHHQTGEPYDVRLEYCLDSQGNFHHKLGHGNHTIFALCGPDQHARLNNFLAHARPIPYFQNGDTNE
ncbi:MAG: hypothetical protein ABIR91_00865 [Candidatus Saccharimonadales bacterium]